MNNTLKNRLQYHITGAIERGEAQAIVEIPPLHTLEMLMNTLETIEELTTEWVNANEDKIRFAAWVRSLTEEQTKSYVRKFSRCEDAPCCGCCD